MKTIDKKAMEFLRPRIEAALEDLAIEMEIDIQLGKGRYMGDNGRFELLVSIVKDGIAIDKKVTDFRDNARRWGFKGVEIGTDITHGGVKYKIIGANVRNRKYPILCQQVHSTSYGEVPGKVFKFSPKMVLDCL